MAAETYTVSVIVLRKTKLGETDLILTLLAADGSQVRAVAKGARKPSNTFASRLELYSCSEVLCSKGKNLDIIKEARLIDGNEHLRIDIEHSASAAPMVELLDKVTQLGLETPKLFEMTQAAFKVLATCSVSALPATTAAHLLKTLAFSGLRPSFLTCTQCGCEIDYSKQGDLVNLSYREGGVLCDTCASGENTILIESGMIKWANFLLLSSFTDIAASEIGVTDAFAVLHFCQTWIQEHVGSNLKSLRFMLVNGLYG